MRRSTAGFALATVVSRVAGLAREMAVAAVFGISAALSAFTVAFQIPNLIRSLVADAALNASFVPVYTELRESGEDDRAWRVASTMVALIILVLVPLTLLSMALAEPIVEIFVGADFAETELAAELFRIMMPTVMLMAASGIIVGVLNAHDHFSVPALAPIAWNVIIIIGVLGAGSWVSDAYEIHVYAVAVLIGTVVQVLLPVPWLPGHGRRLLTGFSPRDPAVRRILLLMLPVTVSLGLINLNLLVNTYFATRVPLELLPGAGTGPAVIDRAFRIYMLPQGVFSVAVATVVFPALARFASNRDMRGFTGAVADGFRQVWMLLIPAAAIFIAIPEPIVALLYERGEFTSADSAAVAAVLVGLSVGLVFNGLSLLLFRAFFSLQKPWVPTIISAASLAGNAVLVAAVHEEFGLRGIAFATSFVNALGVAGLYVLLRARVGAMQTTRTLRVVLASTASAGVAGVVAWAVWDVMGVDAGGGLAALGGVTAASAAAGVAYLGGLSISGTVPMRRVLGILRRR